jgi:hypothetical protein
MATITSTAAAEYIATELAWNGSASDEWIAARLIMGGFPDVSPRQVTAYAVEAGLLRPIPRLGGYTVAKRVNARVFGEQFAEWVTA